MTLPEGRPDRPALPELHNTVVVAAFEGWNDAGDAASDALEHLDAIWEADPIVEIDDEAYYDYQVNRPVIRQVDGVTRELVWPAMRITPLQICGFLGAALDGLFRRNSLLA